jgi:site-specific DNA-methyltransferase (adenine-specific)
MYNINEIKNTIVQGNVLNVLKQMPEKSINMVVTSPPYWGLRNYNTNPQIWDGSENCEHEWKSEIIRKRTDGDKPGKSSKIASHRPNDTVNRPDIINTYCTKCGAWKGELGNESSYELYIKHLIQIFNEVKRVLTDDGTCWVNLGDSYVRNNCHNIKDKSLIGIPDRFKIGMIDNEWICRNDIIWHKPNAMPESVRDRFTDDYERIFFFTKNKKYYFEQQKEPVCDSYNGKRGSGKTRKKLQSAMCGDTNDVVKIYQDRNKRCVWSINTQSFKEAHFAVYPEQLIETPIKAGCPENGIVMDIFMGSGTTGLVSRRLNRNYIGIELNPEYIEIAEKRIKDDIMNEKVELNTYNNQKFIVPKYWADEITVMSFDCTIDEFIKNYTWDDSSIIYNQAKACGLVS